MDEQSLFNKSNKIFQPLPEDGDLFFKGKSGNRYKRHVEMKKEGYPRREELVEGSNTKLVQPSEEGKESGEVGKTQGKGQLGHNQYKNSIQIIIHSLKLITTFATWSFYWFTWI